MGPAETSLTTAAEATLPAIGIGAFRRPVAQAMEPSLLEALQEHLMLELQASLSYWALAIWFGERDLRGFSNYFKLESESERQHAAQFADYLVARGQAVPLRDIPAPRQGWIGLEEILTAVFQMEADLTTSLQQIYAMAERSGDTRTTVFLDPLIQGQTTSENEVAHLLGRVRLSQNQPAAVLLIDGELAAGQHSPAQLA
ncbi:ferritin [Synechococcus sp. CCY9202]|uniref:ferritin n=1 Tax=Synechococcus sp. CCY9202 TaxID=174698 RepID=UPI003A4C71D5